MLVALPSEHWSVWRQANPSTVAERLMELAHRINPKQVATSKRKPKLDGTAIAEWAAGGEVGDEGARVYFC
jgi:hypothetical protein